jgi:probable Rubsico expression protein CbbX
MAAPGSSPAAAAAEVQGSDGGALDGAAPAGVLGPDDVVDLAAERAASAMDEVLERLDAELVGLSAVKARIREIAALLLVDRMRRRFGLDTARPSLHMCFTGSPGTGKTTVALRMAELLKRLGYLERGHLVAVTRDDLVGQYIGHTAPKTREVLKRALGGVLFIDEAYYLYRQENERDYGQEAIEILLQVMENERDHLVVILAGYEDRMDTFFQSNPGMSSRIAHHLEFPDYTSTELVAIAHRLLSADGYELAPDAEAVLASYVELRRRQPRFANARSVRNALERARLRQAGRLVAGATGEHPLPIGRRELMTIEAVDLAQSRVFAERPISEDLTAEPR